MNEIDSQELRNKQEKLMEAARTGNFGGGVEGQSGMPTPPPPHTDPTPPPPPPTPAPEPAVEPSGAPAPVPEPPVVPEPEPVPEPGLSRPLGANFLDSGPDGDDAPTFPDNGGRQEPEAPSAQELLAIVEQLKAAGVQLPGTTPAPTGDTPRREKPSTPTPEPSAAPAAAPAGERAAATSPRRWASVTDAPQEGWRALVSKLPGITLPKSATEKMHDNWLRQVQVALPGNRCYGVWSLKGGTGKTTTALGVATVLHEQARMAVALLDADPMGTAAGVAMESTPSTVTELAAKIRAGSQYIRPYAANTFDEVELFGSQADASVPEITAEDMDLLLTKLTEVYPFTIVDFQAYGLASPVVRTALSHLDALVFVVHPTLRGLDTLPQVPAALKAAGVPELAAKTVYVFPMSDPHLSASMPGLVRQRLQERAEELIADGYNVLEIPFDPALRAEGPDFRFENVAPATRWQFVQTAAALNGLTRGM